MPRRDDIPSDREMTLKVTSIWRINCDQDARPGTRRDRGIPMGTNPNNKSPRTLLSVEEASVLLGVTRSTLYRAIKAGTFPLPVFRIGQRTRIPRRSVDRLLAGLPLSPPEEEPSLADPSLSQATDTHPASSPVLGSFADGESRLPT